VRTERPHPVSQTWRIRRRRRVRHCDHRRGHFSDPGQDLAGRISHLPRPRAAREAREHGAWGRSAGRRRLLRESPTTLGARGPPRTDGCGATRLRPARWNAFRDDHGFTGKEEDVEVGITYFGKRFLSAPLGRWMSADPLGLHDPGQADLNLYAYVRGMALRAVDPLGLAETAAGFGKDHRPTEANMSVQAGPAPPVNASVPESGQELQSVATPQSLHVSQRLAHLSVVDSKPLEQSGPSEVLFAALPPVRIGKAVVGAVTGAGGRIAGALEKRAATKLADAASTEGAQVATLSSEKIAAANAGGSAPGLLTAGSRVPNAGGRIISFVTPEQRTFYRVYSGDSSVGSFLTSVKPRSSAFAREALALPPGNQATFVQEVIVPAGTRIQRSRALPAFGRRGGAEQFELLEHIPVGNFGPGVPLP